MDGIDWTPFREFLLKEYGLDGELEYGLKGGQGSSRMYPFIQKPENLRDKCGLFAKAYTHRKVLSYNEEKYRKFIDEWNFDFTDEDIDTVLSPIILWASMDLRYEYADGGMNGTTLFRCRYTAEDGWTFRKIGE